MIAPPKLYTRSCLLSLFDNYCCEFFLTRRLRKYFSTFRQAVDCSNTSARHFGRYTFHIISLINLFLAEPLTSFNGQINLAYLVCLLTFSISLVMNGLRRREPYQCTIYWNCYSFSEGSDGRNCCRFIVPMETEVCLEDVFTNQPEVVKFVAEKIEETGTCTFVEPFKINDQIKERRMLVLKVRNFIHNVSKLPDEKVKANVAVFPLKQMSCFVSVVKEGTHFSPGRIKIIVLFDREMEMYCHFPRFSEEIAQSFLIKIFHQLFQNRKDEARVMETRQGVLHKLFLLQRKNVATYSFLIELQKHCIDHYSRQLSTQPLGRFEFQGRDGFWFRFENESFHTWE